METVFHSVAPYVRYVYGEVYHLRGLNRRYVETALGVPVGYDPALDTALGRRFERLMRLYGLDGGLSTLPSLVLTRAVY